jgi:hypothetical protein
MNGVRQVPETAPRPRFRLEGLRTPHSVIILHGLGIGGKGHGEAAAADRIARIGTLASSGSQSEAMIHLRGAIRTAVNVHGAASAILTCYLRVSGANPPSTAD